jgi:hypothetical protein
MTTFIGRRKNRVKAFYISILQGNQREFYQILDKGDKVIQYAFTRDLEISGSLRKSEFSPLDYWTDVFTQDDSEQYGTYPKENWN